MTDSDRPRGRYFEELNVGDTMESAAHTITADEIERFADLALDDNPLHIDAAYAQTTAFGQRIAHGLLGLSVASGLAWQTGMMKGTVEAFIGLEWKFRAPIYIDDSVRLRAEVSQKKAMPRLGGGLVIFAVNVLNQRDEVVQKGTWTVLVRSAGRQGDEETR